MKKALSLVLAVILALSVFSSTAFAVTESFVSGVVTAEDGREFSWYIDEENGTLYINGEGEMPELSKAPEWLAYSFGSVNIGEGITKISSEAFLGATALSGNAIVLPESLEAIGERAFYGCEGITELDLKNVKSIGTMAFYGCLNLKDYFILESVKELGAYSIGYFCDEALDDEFAKYHDVKIYSYINSPAYTYAEENEFDFIDLNDYTDYFGYEMIDEECVMLTSFKDCEYSKNITVPENIDGFKVVALSGFIFENSGVEAVNIPASVTDISANAFIGAKKLKAINVEKSDNFASFEGSLYSGDLTCLYKIPEGAVEVAFPETINKIGFEAFRNTSITEIVIPETVTFVDEYAFAFSGIEKIQLPQSLNEVSPWAFAYCESLNEINLENLIRIGDSAFRGCISIENAELSIDLKMVGGAAFHGTGLNEITIPDGVEEIGEKAFGYYAYDDIEFAKKEEFVIKGKGETLAQSYAEENDFNFVDEAPAAPQIYYGYADTVAVSVFWLSSADAEHYEIYRKTTGTEYEKIYSSADADTTHYIDFDVENNVAYTYSVVAVKGVLKSSFESGITVKYMALNTPEMKSAKSGSKGITVNWGAVDGAEGYTLYRRTENGGWVRIAEFEGNVESYCDVTVKSGVAYDYTVKAYVDEIESGYDVEGVSAIYLATPKLVKAVNDVSGVKITWKKVGGAESYAVYRKVGKGDWTKIATTKDVSSFIDKTAKTGTTYIYTVVALKDGARSSHNKTGVSCLYVAMPKVTKIANASNGIQLNWKAISGGGGYIIYRKENSGAWKKLAKTTDASKTGYLDKSVKSGVKYTYALKACKSSVVSAYEPCSIVYLSAPKLLKATSGKKGVTVKWDDVKGAEGYIVYRATGSGAYQKLATVKGKDTVSYLDKSAKKGVTYKYTVKAYKGSSKSFYNKKGLTVKDKY